MTPFQYSNNQGRLTGQILDSQESGRTKKLSTEPWIGRNTGIIGGKFLERSKVALPNEDAFKKTPLSFYSTRDFFIGAQLLVNNYCFVLCGADDYGMTHINDSS